MNPFYLKDIHSERELRLQGRSKPDSHASLLWGRALSGFSTEEDIETLNKAYKFAKAIDYHHEGMESSIYFPHSLRVASLALLSLDNNVNAGVVGLLHNVLETSDTPVNTISHEFGAQIAIQVEHLTVNRELQWDEAYKELYYKNINSSAIECRIVKIFDKVDNIFILNINPDEVIRQKYLNEINAYILPMIKRDIPSILEYTEQLIEDCYTMGQINVKY